MVIGRVRARPRPKMSLIVSVQTTARIETARLEKLVDKTLRTHQPVVGIVIEDICSRSHRTDSALKHISKHAYVLLSK